MPGMSKKKGYEKTSLNGESIVMEIDEDLLKTMDQAIENGWFHNRDELITDALAQFPPIINSTVQANKGP